MKRLLIAVVILLLLAFPSPVKADVAPPEQPSGTNPEPGSEATQVRMAAETVLIDVLADTPTGSLGQARVHTDFIMRNLGVQTETMAVRFPISSNDGFSHYPEIKNITVKVEGSSVATRQITGKDPRYGVDDVPWVEFPATFQPGKDVDIQVDYTLEASGMFPFIWFTYIFSSGAGWKDSIGSADLTVRLPYPVTDQNVTYETDPAYTYPGDAKKGFVSDNEIHWSYQNFEPTANDNFRIELVAPSAWQKVLKSQAYTAQYPNDGEGWGILGKAYKQLVFSPKRGLGIHGKDYLDTPTGELYRLSKQAYDKAVTLKPDDPLWHAGYADLLANYAYWGKWSTDTTGEAQQAMREIQKALALAPADRQVQDIAFELASYFQDGMVHNGSTYIYLWLTASPIPPTPTLDISLPALVDTPAPTLMPQIAQSPSSTPEVAAIPTSGASSAVPTSSAGTVKTNNGTGSSKPVFPFCGSLLLIPLGLFFFWRFIH
jgi:hypothetical protein